MATKVLDSWALLAFFKDEPGVDEVERLLLKAEEGRHRLLMSVVNWGEVYYSTLRGATAALADRVMTEIAGMPIEIIPADRDLTRQAAMYKATKKMSYADCFAAALAKIKNAELVTGDEEFREVEGEIKILWIARKE